MSNAWGNSWGASWGAAWGAIRTIVTAISSKAGSLGGRKKKGPTRMDELIRDDEEILNYIETFMNGM